MNEREERPHKIGSGYGCPATGTLALRPETRAVGEGGLSSALPSRRPPTTSPLFQITNQKVSTSRQDLTQNGARLCRRPAAALSNASATRDYFRNVKRDRYNLCT